MTVKQLCDIGVYHDSGTSLWHFDQLNDHCYRFNQKDYFQYPESLDNFISSNYSIKFAGFHVPFPEENSWIDRLLKIKGLVAHVFIFCSELHQRTVEQIISLDLPNTSIYICGFIDHEFKNAKVYQWMDWFITTSYFYSRIRPKLLDDKLIFNFDKKYKFDILLGCRRTHRDFIYNHINSNNLKSQVLMTYHKRADLDLRLSNEFIFEDDNCQLVRKMYTHTVDPVLYYDTNMTLSQIVPISIYNQTYYSVVAETNYWSHFNFYTEKIVKPILSKRLFICFAGKNYLQNLQKLGFRTFSSVIDESYDLESDDTLRWKMVMKQLENLLYQDPCKIYAKIKDVVEYNQRLMLTRNWYKDFSLKVKSEIDPFLTTAHIIAD